MASQAPAGETAVYELTESEWRRSAEGLNVLAPLVQSLLQRLLAEGLSRQPHSIACRVKSFDSARRKIQSKSSRGYSFGDITDVLGVRIITYFQDDVDAIASIIEREFDVDAENSVDKRALLDPDRFGYLSLHYVVRISPSRAAFSEYKRFENVRFEIQIRSILQHAWAEIEHDLGYKSKGAVPAEVRRRFSRLAGLLELADVEFEHIRDELEVHRAKVSRAVDDRDLSLEIDRDSISAYIASSVLLRELEMKLRDSLGGVRAAGGLGFSSHRASDLQAVGIRTLERLDALLQENGEVLWRFARNWWSRPEAARRGNKVTVPDGVLLFYLALLEATKVAGKAQREALAAMRVQRFKSEKLLDARRRAEAEVSGSGQGPRRRRRSQPPHSR
ncbi:hypothetical protein AB0F83_08025 [Micromonospora chalcea]|uniref:GTP pyrophosphokinase n=1 Tax=Micromonospora chalcea TaxID=1874 RepID=UPI00340D0E85